MLNKIKNQCHYDLMTYISFCIKFYIPLIIITSVVLIKYQNKVDYALFTGQLSINPNLLDYMIEFFKGQKVYNSYNRNNPFEISPIWLFRQMYVGYITQRFISFQLNNNLHNTITHSQNKSIWLNSKYIWCVLNTLFIYLIYYLTIIIVCICYKNSLCFDLQIDLNKIMSDIDISLLTSSNVLYGIFLSPIMASIAVTIMQVSITVFYNSIYSYIFLSIVCVSSTYYCHELLIGNSWMFQRNNFIISDGFNPITLILINILLIIVSIVYGNIHFVKKDIF